MLRALCWLTVFHLALLCWSLQEGNSPQLDDQSFWVDPWGRLAEVRAHFERKRFEHEQFQRYVEKLEKRIFAGLALPQAVDQLVAYSEDYYPSYLHGLEIFGESGRTVRQKVAFNLYRHFHDWSERAFLNRLQKELSAMVGEAVPVS